MKKIFSLFAAALVALSVTAAPAASQLAVKKLEAKQHSALLTKKATVAKALEMKADKKVARKGAMLNHFNVPAVKSSIKYAPAHTNAEFAVTCTATNITATGAHVEVSPADQTVTYYWDVFTEQIVYAAANGQLASEGINSIEDLVLYGYEVGNESTGDDSWDYTTLSPSTTYLILAVQVDVTTGEAVGEAGGGDTFDTEEAPASENEISLEFDADESVINVTTTNEDQYFYVILSQEMYSEMASDYSEESLLGIAEGVISMFDQRGYTKYFVASGDTVIYPEEKYIWVDGLVDGNDYVAIAVPYVGTINGTPAYTTFTYLAPADPTSYTDITVANANLYKAYLSEYGILDVYGWNNDSTALAEFLYMVDDVATADYTAFTPDSVYEAAIILINGADTTEIEVRKYIDFQVATPDDENYILESHVLGKDGNGYFVTMNFTTAIVITDTIELAFPTVASITDATATDGWWQAMVSAGSTTGSVCINTDTLYGTFGAADFDYDFTYIRTTSGYIYATPYDGNTCTVSIDGDTTIIDAYFLTESDLFFHVIMKKYIPAPTDTVAIVFIDGDMEDVGGGYTYYGKDEYDTTGWELSFYLPSGAGTYSLDDLYNPNRYDQTYQTPCSYLVDWNTKTLINIAQANIVVASDGSFTADLISNNTVLYQITFTPETTGVEEISKTNVAKKAIMNGKVVVIRNGKAFNMNGARL